MPEAVLGELRVATLRKKDLKKRLRLPPLCKRTRKAPFHQLWMETVLARQPGTSLVIEFLPGHCFDSPGITCILPFFLMPLFPE